MNWTGIIILWVACAALVTGFIFEPEIANWERKWIEFFKECRERGIPSRRIVKGIVFAIFCKGE
jgi:hypothetical protein